MPKQYRHLHWYTTSTSCCFFWLLLSLQEEEEQQHLTLLCLVVTWRVTGWYMHFAPEFDESTSCETNSKTARSLCQPGATDCDTTIGFNCGGDDEVCTSRVGWPQPALHTAANLPPHHHDLTTSPHVLSRWPHAVCPARVPGSGHQLRCVEDHWHIDLRCRHLNTVESQHAV